MTSRTSDRHSRVISWLKVIFPLTALALLSTLFLLSRSIDPDAQIPFADKEIQDRMRDQQITGPFFSGTTADGDQISFTAQRLITPQGDGGTNEALDIRADLASQDGSEVSLTAARARLDMAANRAELSGQVTVQTSTGYKIQSDTFVSALTDLSLHAPGEVTASGPAGTLKAGSMTLSKPENGGNTQLIFTKGVKLVYTPRERKE